MVAFVCRFPTVRFQMPLQIKFLGSEMQNHIVRICENVLYCVYSDVPSNGMHARLLQLPKVLQPRPQPAVCIGGGCEGTDLD